MSIGLDDMEGGVTINTQTKGQFESRQLHPATVKRWMEILLNDSRLGPEIRKRMMS